MQGKGLCQRLNCIGLQRNYDNTSDTTVAVAPLNRETVPFVCWTSIVWNGLCVRGTVIILAMLLCFINCRFIIIFLLYYVTCSVAFNCQWS